jgi:hypothetical protein
MVEDNQHRCPKCGGAGLVLGIGGNYYRCPVCMAPMWGDNSFSIEWDDAEKQYDVLLTFPKGSLRDASQLTRLPSLIMEGSRCSCGGLLRVANHSFRNVEGNIVFCW